MSSLSFLLYFRGHCTSMGWCFQSHRYLHLRPAGFRGVQTSLTQCMQKLPGEMSLGDLGPPLYMNSSALAPVSHFQLWGAHRVKGEERNFCLGPAAGGGPRSGVILSNGLVDVMTLSLCSCSPSF